MHALCRTLIALVVAIAVPVTSPLPAAADFADPPTTGKVVWMFSGAKSDVGIATSVHCSNFDPVKTATVTVEFFDLAGSLVDSGTSSVGPGDQQSFSTQNTFYAELILSSDPFQGSARVVVDGTKKVICSAHVLSTAVPPSFVIDLSRFNKQGKP